MNLYLTFSDAAKYADIARNLVLGNSYETTFSFFFKPYFTGMWIPPVMPFSIAAFFKLFGVNDFAVIATSFFYFLLTLLFVFLLAKKVFKDNFVATLSTLSVGFNYDLINYATTGASESPFIFEIVAASYFVSLKNRWGTAAAFLILVLMYFTRPQAFIYIAGIFLYWLLVNFNTRKAIFYFLLVSVLGILIDNFVLSPLSGKYFLYSVLGRGTNVLSQVGLGQSASDQLRSGMLTHDFSVLTAFKKLFYNLYNFYKLLPQIMSPYLFAIFVIGLFKWSGNRIYNSFKISAIFMIIATFITAAASIPFFRYTHPVVPLIYIIAVATIVEIFNYGFLNLDQFSLFNFKIKKHIFVIATSTLLILFFVVGQTFGILFLDSRFKSKNNNIDKPPVYVLLSEILEDNTNPDQIIITNLDTWGSWYGQRKTIWFPINPKQLIDKSSGKIPFDAIYLTSYLMNDENYYMGKDWREILENPNNPHKWACEGCGEIANEFILKSVSVVAAGDNFEQEDARAVLFVRK